jgi:hypothetical protein
LGITETLAGVTSLDISDSEGISEGMTEETVFKRPQDESVAISEAMTVDTTKPLSDTANIVETEQKTITGIKTEAILITESEEKVIDLVLADSVSIADLGGQSFYLTFDDAISIAETIRPLIITRLLPTDSISFSENLVFEIKLAKTETEGIGESMGNSYNLTISDSTTIIESEQETTAKEGLADAITMTEDLVKDLGLVLDDSLDIAEAESTTGIKFLILTDSTGITETSIVKPGRELADNISITEGLIQGLKLYFSETLALTEGLESVNEFYRTESESLSLAESSGRTVARPEADEISFAESSIRGITIKPSESLLILEECTPDVQATERIGQKAFLRTTRAQ